MVKKGLLLLLLFVGILFANVNNPEAKAREKSIRIGNFQYTYSDYRPNRICITNIKILSSNGISTLKIPSSIGGKKVAKLGKEHSDNNVFGIWVPEEPNEVVGPQEILKKVKKIKKIVLPPSLEMLSKDAFYGVQNGKSINIPSGLMTNVDELCEIKWKEFKISPNNKMYQVKDGLLCSKDGLEVYGSVLSREKIYIPQGCKEAYYEVTEETARNCYEMSVLELYGPSISLFLRNRLSF